MERRIMMAGLATLASMHPRAEATGALEVVLGSKSSVKETLPTYDLSEDNYQRDERGIITRRYPKLTKRERRIARKRASKPAEIVQTAEVGA